MTSFFCDHRAYQFLRENLKRVDSVEGLLACATAVAMHAVDDCCPDQVNASLERIEQRVQRRLQTDDPLAVLSHLHAEWFDEQQLTGDDFISRHPTAAFVPFVLLYRRGLPVILCLLYHVTARRLGLETDGVALPGHFLVRVKNVDQGANSEGALLIDPSLGGRLVTELEAAERCRERFAAGSVVDLRAPISFLPVTHRQWVWRILDDLQRLLRRGDYQQDWQAIQEMRGLLRDNDPHRELAAL